MDLKFSALVELQAKATYKTFESNVGFFAEVGIERADLGRLGDQVLVGVLEVSLLDLHRLLNLLGAE